MTQRGARVAFQQRLRDRGVEVVEFDFLTPDKVAQYCYRRGFLQVPPSVFSASSLTPILLMQTWGVTLRSRPEPWWYGGTNHHTSCSSGGRPCGLRIASFLVAMNVSIGVCQI